MDEGSSGVLRDDAVELTIVIPCLDVAETLGRQLEALASERPSFAWEIIVVDNGSTDGTVAIAEAYRTLLPNLRIVKEFRRGRHHACNAGWRLARGSKVAFVDGDDVIQPGYVSAIHAALERHDVVAGRLIHRSARGEPITGWGQVQTGGLMPSLGFLPYASGGNLAARVSALAAVSGFAEDVPYGEDVDLSWRLQLAGYTISFDPNPAVVVYQRASLWSMFRQHRRFGAAQARLYSKFRVWGMPRRSVRVAVADWLKVFAALPFLGDDDVRVRAVRRFARNVGRIEGSLRVRVFYP